MAAWFSVQDRRMERVIENALAIRAAYGANTDLWFDGQMAEADRDTRRALQEMRKALRRLH